MVSQVKMFLQQDEYSALVELALKEMRNPTEQARFILRQELERQGFLSTKSLENERAKGIQNGSQ